LIGKRADYLTAPGARTLAQRIEAYWAQQGLRVLPWVERLGPGVKDGEGIYMVRSGMVNGMPQMGVR
jgi:hypothetical protein